MHEITATILTGRTQFHLRETRRSVRAIVKMGQSKSFKREILNRLIEGPSFVVIWQGESLCVSAHLHEPSIPYRCRQCLLCPGSILDLPTAGRFAQMVNSKQSGQMRLKSWPATLRRSQTSLGDCQQHASVLSASNWRKIGQLTACYGPQ